jgi:hypothetical protein
MQILYCELLNWYEVSWRMGPLRDHMIFVFNLNVINRIQIKSTLGLNWLGPHARMAASPPAWRLCALSRSRPGVGTAPGL